MTESSEKPKDLTAITEDPSAYPSAESFTETPSETIQTFESLEELSAAGEGPIFPSFEGEIPAEPPAAVAPESEPLAEPETAPSVMDQVKSFSEDAIAPLHNDVPAAFPFSLKITGHLESSDKERLLDILSREKMGVREMDLEPQLAHGKILIPRISEFAGILLIQALRASQAKMELYPSDALEDLEHQGTSFSAANSSHATQFSEESGQQAEHLPITTEETLPQLPHANVIDTVTATASIGAQSVEIEKTAEYQELLDALQKELKYKAYRKGAEGIVNFTIQLIPLQYPTRYRLLLTGQAVSHF